ncbi:MAG TPA: hypothetical protein VLT83_14715 [Opitutaceae bacterium]|nr:hypothetical protein [Opitutaceae bacterium]
MAATPFLEAGERRSGVASGGWLDSLFIDGQNGGGMTKAPSPFFVLSVSAASSAFRALDSSASIRALSLFVNSSSAGSRAPQ